MSAHRLNGEPVVLYDDDSGASGDVTLSESAANFTRLVIMYKSNDGFYASAEVWHPDGKAAALLSALPTSNAMYMKGRVVKISGTRISTNVSGTTTNSGQGTIKTSPTYQYANYVLITQVLGYR